MNVDRMRAIDRWVGIPLCFLLTGVLRFIERHRGGTTPRKLLFVELSEMGSTILADPAMREARDRLGTELHFVIFKRNAASLGFLNTVPAENIFTIRSDSLMTLAVDTVRFLRWCRDRHIDTVVDLELFSRFTALLTGLSGAANRVGFYRFHNEGLYRGELLTHRVAYNPHVHIAKNFLALIASLQAPPQVPYSKVLIADDRLTLPKVPVSPQERTDMVERVRRALPDFDAARHRLILLNPNASELLPQRRWPGVNFIALARLILDRWPDAMVLLTGAQGEAAEAQALASAINNPRLASFAGGCRLTELPALYDLASLLVTNDSGPGHFSAVTDMPSIVLFGPETPALYGSLGRSTPIFAGLACSPCVSAANHRKTACRDPLCMTAITPQKVFAAVESVLS